MTDFLLKFDHQDDFDLPAGEPPCWLVDGKTIMPVSVVTAEAVYGEADPGDESGAELVSPEECAPGIWYVVAADDDFSHLAIVPWGECPGRVTPVFAGRDFPIS